MVHGDGDGQREWHAGTLRHGRDGQMFMGFAISRELPSAINVPLPAVTPQPAAVV